MAKRKTKEQRETEQFQALYVRVCDITATAAWEVPEEDSFAVSLCDYPRLLWAVKHLLLPDDAADFLTSPFNAEKYADPETLTDFLFEAGIRA